MKIFKNALDNQAKRGYQCVNFRHECGFTPHEQDLRGGFSHIRTKCLSTLTNSVGNNKGILC